MTDNRVITAPHQLVITRRAWEAALRPLLAQPGGFAVGRMRWLATEQDRRLLVEGVELIDRVPSGDRFPPLADWCVFHVSSAERDIRSARELLARLRPKASQTVAAVVVDPGGNVAQSPNWDGAVYMGEGRVIGIAGLRVVGPGMLRVEREPVDDLPAAAGSSHDDSAVRYSRLEGAVGMPVVQRLRQAAVTLIGAGRNGSAIAFQLASLGVRTIRLVDADTLGPENLDAMPGLAVADLGRPKVTALAERLLRLRPDLSVSRFDAPLTDGRVAAALRRLPADLLVTTVDSDTPRLAASLLARETLTVHLDVGTSVTRAAPGEMLLAGDVRLLLPGSGCVWCVGGLADREATLYELSAPPKTLRRGRPLAWHQERAGSLVSLNAIAVGVAVQAWLDLLAGRLRTSCWHRLRWLPGEGIQADSGLVSAGEDCPYCRQI